MTPTSAPKGKDPGTRTDASADGTGVLRCLWSDLFGIDRCPALEDRHCCLVDDARWYQLTLWGDEEPF